MKMVIYLDGGSKPQPNAMKRWVLSFGLVIHFQDQTHELSGAILDVVSAYSGQHENFAFLEAIKFAHSQQVKPENIAFVTDDSAVCEVNKWAREFGKLDPASKTINRLKELMALLAKDRGYYDAMYPYLRDCLQYGKFTKVKGHASTVYNLRCDELAITARNWALGDLTPILPFEEWLHDGFEYWVQREVEVEKPGLNADDPPIVVMEKIGVRKYWYAPFSDLHDLDFTEKRIESVPNPHQDLAEQV
jgi:ribonuclease HI